MEVTPEEDLFYEEDETQAPSILPEEVVLPLPSNIISAKTRSSFKCLISIEMELQKGQANDALEGLWIGLANKSLLLQTDVNQSTSTKQSTRAWASVRNTQSQILLHAWCYQRACKALKSIGTPEDLEVYQKLSEKDLVVVKDITMVNHFGQGSDTLAWFWRIGPSEDKLTGEWMEEYEPNLFIEFTLYWFIIQFIMWTGFEPRLVLINGRKKKLWWNTKWYGLSFGFKTKPTYGVATLISKGFSV